MLFLTRRSRTSGWSQYFLAYRDLTKAQKEKEFLRVLDGKGGSLQTSGPLSAVMVTAEIFTDLNLESSGPQLPPGLLAPLFQPPSVSLPRIKMGAIRGPTYCEAWLCGQSNDTQCLACKNFNSILTDSIFL